MATSHEDIIIDAKDQKIPFDENSNKQYEIAVIACGVQSVAAIFETFTDPLISPPSNDQFDNTNEDTLESPERLGSIDPQRDLIVGSKNIEGDGNEDPNSLPPQAPPAGEADDRAEDREKQKTAPSDPVDLFTGEFFIEKVDFELFSIGFPFVLIRTYKSGRPFFGPLGYNWDHNYNIYLRELNDGRIAVSTGRLQEDIYTDSGCRASSKSHFP